jgi:hypothetical protein
MVYAHPETSQVLAHKTQIHRLRLHFSNCDGSSSGSTGSASSDSSTAPAPREFPVTCNIAGAPRSAARLRRRARRLGSVVE